MRTALLTATLVVAASVAGAAQNKQKVAPRDTDIIEMVGGRIAKMFAQYGTPESLYAQRSEESPELDVVIVEYTDFSFSVRGKTVGVCHFERTWKGEIKGIRIGDTRNQVVKVLGEDFELSEVANRDGVFDCKWDLAELDARLWVIFDKEDKATLVQVQLK
jgi:hypothetical protein